MTTESGDRDPDAVRNPEGVLSEAEAKAMDALREGTPDILIPVESADAQTIRSEVLAEAERNRLEKLYRLRKEK